MDTVDSTPTMSGTGESTGGGLRLAPSCDVCGLEVRPEDYYTAELTVSGAMCPSPMTFHKACYEQAASMWHPDPDSYCTVDPLFPETSQWAQPRGGEGEAEAGA